MKILEKLNLDKSKLQVDEKYHYFILAGVLLLVFVLNYFLILGNQLKALNKVNPKILVLESNIERFNNNLARLGQHKVDITSLKEKLVLLKGKARLEEEVPLILDLISRKANQTDVKIEQIMPVKAAKEELLSDVDGKYILLPIFIQVRAGYHQLGKFLQKLENADMMSFVSELQIEGNESDIMRHNSEITIQTIIFKKD